jgi:6-pyruvoyltetrahydropterin/6-carboxytetrahydropterin synthase
MYELRVQSHFSAAHALRQYSGDCEQLHGHNWTVEVRLTAPELDRLGLAMDFREAKALLGEVLGALDHRFLNDLDPFRVDNPSTERIAHYIYDALVPRLPAGVALAEVTAWETPGCGATYRP